MISATRCRVKDINEAWSEGCYCEGSAWSGPGGIERSSICFFFSSRRRHTRFDCDWSSDVCSSDLSLPRTPRALPDGVRGSDLVVVLHPVRQAAVEQGEGAPSSEDRQAVSGDAAVKIGRASCRERV